MIPSPLNYNIYFDFIESYLPEGFSSIKKNHPLIKALEAQEKTGKQFMYIADLIQLKLIYATEGSKSLIGVAPDELSFSHFMDYVHPDDATRLNTGRTKLLKMAQDIYVAQKGAVLLSTNMRYLNAEGECSNILLQNYLFYSTTPRKTVYFLKVHTNIGNCNQFKNGYHYYNGTDLSMFRYPDNDLLKVGPICTQREMEIIELIELGHSTNEIADKLFISHHTVSKHRSNILEKTGKANIWDLILHFKTKGLL